MCVPFRQDLPVSLSYSWDWLRRVTAAEAAPSALRVFISIYFGIHTYATIISLGYVFGINSA